MAMKDMQAEGKTSVKSKIGPQKIFLLKTRIVFLFVLKTVQSEILR